MDKNILALRDVIDTCRARIKDIQDGCDHDKFEVCMFMHRPGAMSPQRLCSDCGGNAEGITEEEIKKCWGEWEMPQTQAGYDVIMEESINGKRSSTTNG